MGGQPLQVVMDGDARWGARMEPSQSTLMQRDLIIVADELHQHARYQYHHIIGVCLVVSSWEKFHRRSRRSDAFGLCLCGRGITGKGLEVLVGCCGRTCPGRPL